MFVVVLENEINGLQHHLFPVYFLPSPSFLNTLDVSSTAMLDSTRHRLSFSTVAPVKIESSETRRGVGTENDRLRWQEV